MTLHIHLEAEADGRWLAEIPALPGVMTYGKTQEEALTRVQALALRAIAEQLENGERPAELLSVSFETAD
jgi:predicted RNase H-like HicB family nuclease